MTNKEILKKGNITYKLMVGNEPDKESKRSKRYRKWKEKRLKICEREYVEYIYRRIIGYYSILGDVPQDEDLFRIKGQEYLDLYFPVWNKLGMINKFNRK